MKKEELKSFPCYIGKDGKSKDLELWLEGDFLPIEIKKKLIEVIKKKQNSKKV
ncbi:hypothetical protein M0R19_04690 [Candidatus Pacearchaeota archaeon]|jgi:hypothetical protein|nr:hypothetical protein [Candidatus Pacearchaeota archaeon]